MTDGVYERRSDCVICIAFGPHRGEHKRVLRVENPPSKPWDWLKDEKAAKDTLKRG